MDYKTNRTDMNLKQFTFGLNKDLEECMVYHAPSGCSYNVVGHYKDVYLFRPHYGTILWAVGVRMGLKGERVYTFGDIDKAISLYKKIVNEKMEKDVEIFA